MVDSLMRFIHTINIIIAAQTDLEVLGSSFSNLMPTVHNYCNTILVSVVRPVGYAILALFFLLELYHATQRADALGGGNQMGVMLIVRILIKIVLCKMLLDYTPEILGLIYDISTSITLEISKLLGDSSSIAAIDEELFRAELEAQGFWANLLSGVFILLAFLLFIAAVLMADVVLLARVVEIYVLFTLSPLPMATLPNEEFSQIGKSFLKRFTATCLHGTVIYIVLALFPSFITWTIIDNDGIGYTLTSLIMLLLYSVILIVCIFSTRKWAQAITGSN